MPLLCSYCHKEITEAPIAAIHLGCSPKVMELAAQQKAAIALLNRWIDDPEQDFLLGETDRFVRSATAAEKLALDC
jgi:hypothetical protein